MNFPGKCVSVIYICMRNVPVKNMLCRMYGWMDVWMDGCMDGWMDGWMDR